MVVACEKALKLVSDALADNVIKSEEDVSEDGDTKPTTTRLLKGVMRVGLLAKGLLLHENLDLHLVVLCSKKPTLEMVVAISNELPKHLEEQVKSGEKYEVKNDGTDIFVIRTSDDEPLLQCTISLTSPAVKDDDQSAESKLPDPDNMLDKSRCLVLLAELRHAKWFQARVSPYPHSLIVIRLLMDLCQRNVAWAPLSQWALELMVEKAVCSAGVGVKVTANDAFVRVLQCIASGVLLEDGYGIFDVCEKEQTDATESLTKSNCEDLTACAQHMLRQVVLGLSHKVLDVEPPSISLVGNGASQCKRPRIGAS
jgi:zinc finger RNA-binding protein